MISLHLGDCLDIMREMDAESVDAIVTDPPYGLSFMGKDWDYGVPGIHFWSEALRVVKPGAYLLAFGGTRTYHRLVCAIEDAGFEIRDTIEWVYGSGFPKSLDVSKAIDKAVGAERQDAGPYIAPDGNGRTNDTGITGGRFGAAQGETWQEKRLTYPSTDSARKWSGWGTALKPAHEPIVVARKPLSEATVAANVLRWGTGALNIDAARVETDGSYTHRTNGIYRKCGGASFGIGGGVDGTREIGTEIHPQGRFPANLITDGSAEVVAMFPSPHGAGNAKPAGGHNRTDNRSIFDNSKGGIGQGDYGGMRHGDTGSASRFFAVCPLDEDDYPPLYYCAKASRGEREAGLYDTPLHATGERDGRRFANNSPAGKYNGSGVLTEGELPRHNGHPCVKPLSLMRYLITLCTREGATVLDPFMGSGTTGVACVQLNRNFIGCEIDPQYFEIAKRRIEAAQPIAIELPLMAEA